ncbi:7 transmembrane receptor (rhodopsin family) domain-containing protein [Ditylenchus destructor]|uniref:7 transmembrane receptor (Rhodopsin family) domain-containing protein n=1 Tax=Ditylenchus destructor TaxID=166010 RepID=A0AAD4MKM3_9BILA|nr:7 transmembrane receptor (rhodopsin family) domain-containing protein [Ditylenchus destructor]
MRSSSMSLFLANLAAIDFLMLADLPVTYFTHIPTSVYGGLLNAVFNTNIAICIERYVAVVHPFQLKTYFPIRRTLQYILAIWMVPVVWQLVHGLVMKKETWSTLFTIEVIYYVIPTFVLTTLYTLTCRALWGKNAFLHAAGNKKALNGRRSAVKMLLLCVVIFYICYAIPLLTVWISCESQNIRVVTTIDLMASSLWSTFLMPVANSINPFIYTLYSVAFRKRVKEIFCCCCSCGQPAQKANESHFPNIKTTTVTMSKLDSDVVN